MLVDVFQRSTSELVLAGVVVTVLTLGFMKLKKNSKIYKLGGRAAQVPSYPLLFGLDIIWESVKWARKHKNLELLSRRFEILKTNTVELNLLGERIILTQDPENIKAILASQFGDYGKGKAFHKDWAPFLGNSIFTTDGQEWHASRQLIRPQFLKERVADLHTFERHITHMVKYIPKDGGVVDMKDLFYRFTLDSATEFLLGNSVDSLGTPKIEFAVAFGEIQKFMDRRLRLGPMQWLLAKGDFNKNIQTLNSFVEPFVRQTLEMKPEQLKEKTEKEYNFLHALAEFTRDPQMLRDQLVAVLLAARDTTAATLSWTVYELSKQPKIVERLRKDIMDVLGPDTLPTYTDLKDMKYLQHIINEILRLYPAIPFNVRCAVKDTTLPRGAGPDGNDPIGIPEGTTVAYSPLAMQRRKDLFGPDADKFDPDRWDKWAPKSWQYIPFNGGPRICIGQQFALTEIGYTLVRIFQEFEAVEWRGTEEQWMQTEIVGVPGAGVSVSFRPAAK